MKEVPLLEGLRCKAQGMAAPHSTTRRGVEETASSLNEQKRFARNFDDR